MKVCLIIPSYNEEDNILRVYEDIKNNAPEYDYIFINDCSTDNSKQVFANNHIKVINLPVNLGLTGAVQTGYKYAYEKGYDCAVQFDGDGQHKAIYIKELVKAIEQGNNIAIGSRFVTEKKPWSLRMLGSRIIAACIFLKTGKSIKDPTSGFRMLDSKMMKDYAYNVNRKPEPDTLVYQLRKGAKIAEVQVAMEDRVAGTSIYAGLFNSMSYMIKMIISIIFIS
ncbi:MAG: glycosyltransferase family 2 protein [Erysipelotrichaceae bacterium]|nr:glycosyltransferase family 2 protein [Erysipelotrichaceae bacterium]MDY5252438.1 glycosyltransferase family 2 protein [Erysipelotrichaceae bacterium]